MSGADPLGLDPETMRELGYRTVDMLVDWLERRDGAAAPPRPPAEMRARLVGRRPGRGRRPFEEILAAVARDVLPFMSRVHHPRFFAFIPGSGTWPGALGDLIASAANVYAGSWMESAGPSQVELEVLDWFKEWIGYPASAGGRPRQRRLGGEHDRARVRARGAASARWPTELVAYVSDQAHSSLARAARVLGFRPEQVRVLPVDERPPAAAGRARGRDGGRRAPPAGGRCSSSAQRGLDEHRRGRPARRSWRRSAASTARGSTSTRRTAASRR